MNKNLTIEFYILSHYKMEDNLDKYKEEVRLWVSRRNKSRGGDMHPGIKNNNTLNKYNYVCQDALGDFNSSGRDREVIKKAFLDSYAKFSQDNRLSDDEKNWLLDRWFEFIFYKEDTNDCLVLINIWKDTIFKMVCEPFQDESLNSISTLFSDE